MFCNEVLIVIREASHIDFPHKKRHMYVRGWGGLAVVTFLRKAMWKKSIVC